MAGELSMDCPGTCRQHALSWCHGMEPEGDPLDLLTGVAGNLGGSLRNGLTSLCDTPGVYLPADYAILDPYTRGLSSLYYFSAGFGPGDDTGLVAPIIRWAMASELSSQFDQSSKPQTYDTGSRFAPWAGPALDSVLSTRGQADRPVRRSKFCSLEAYVRERMADGFWYAAYSAADAAAADDWYLSRNSAALHEYAIDSVCAFDTFSHPRALREDALYGASDYDRDTVRGLHQPLPDAYQDVLFNSAYIALASYVWGANAHLDLMQGQISRPPPTNHWYAGVWHDALFGRSVVTHVLPVVGRSAVAPNVITNTG
ncbi:hypothetical protein EYZ11_009868 [Aspergillus tanneri]|uniref:Uncharacterized protein n=1 Tax=Aspergillus tanneri TaxID=1220188 RepID=A0A4S3J729_9EURO|nr:hypothetical protein EYZ11_009868 [Aspergillus tanneri]